MKDTSNMKIFFEFSDETLERDFATTGFLHTQVYYNELEPADDSAKVTVPFDVVLANKLKGYKNENVKVRIKDGADNYLTGYVRKNSSFEKTQSNQPIKLEIVNPSYLLDVDLKAPITLTNCRVDSVIAALLNACKFRDVRNLSIPTVIPYFHMDDGDNVLDALAELCKEYGYTFNFDNDGYFDVYPIFDRPTGEITQRFDGSNCLSVIKMELREEQADSISASWSKIQFVENALLFSDTSGGDETYKCKIQVEPNKYLFDAEENYCNYDSTLGTVKFATTCAPAFVHDDQIEVTKCVNCGTKALVSAYNRSDSGQYRFTRFDIYGDAYIEVATNTTNETAGTTKSKDVDIRYLYDAELVETYVKNLVNYYRYADFEINLSSATDYPIGSFCVVTDNGFGSVTGRIVQKRLSLLEDKIDYVIEGISEFVPAVVKTVTKIPSSGVAKGDQGVKGEDGDTIVCPDLSQCVFYFSMDDVLNNKLINNAAKEYATLNGCQQVSGLNGSALKIDSTKDNYLSYAALPALSSMTLALFVRPSSWGIVTQQTASSYLVEMGPDKIVLKPDPSGQITINGTFYLDTWYLIVYTYDSDSTLETVYVYRYGVESGQYVYQDKQKVSFAKSRDFMTDWNDTLALATTGLASGTIDEFRLDSYAWPDNSADAYAVLKGTVTKKYTLGDYSALNLDSTVSTITPKYLGAHPSDPVVANVGDWYAYVGETTPDRKKAFCYFKVNANLWAEETNWDHIVGAMSDLLELTTDQDVPAVTFLNKLIANEAFIKKLAAQIITLSAEGTIKSENYAPGSKGFSIGGDGRSEFVGMTAKDIVVTGNSIINEANIVNATIRNANITSDSTLEDITITGNSLFTGDINSGPLFLSSSQAAGEYHTIAAGTRAEVIWNLLASWGYPIAVVQNDSNYYSQRIMVNVVGSYGSRNDVMKISCGLNDIVQYGGHNYSWTFNIYFSDGTSSYASAYYPSLGASYSFGIANALTFAKGAAGKTLKLTGLPTNPGLSGTVYVSNGALMVSP